MEEELLQMPQLSDSTSTKKKGTNNSRFVDLNAKNTGSTQSIVFLENRNKNNHLERLAEDTKTKQKK